MIEENHIYTEAEINKLNADLARHQELIATHEEFLKFQDNYDAMQREVIKYRNRLKDLEEKKQVDRSSSEIYQLIIRKVKENPELNDSWTDFLMMLKLTCPEIEDEMYKAATTPWNS